MIDYAATQHVDYKTELQEQLARRKRQVSYSVIEVEGPAHERRFTCAAVIDGQQVGEGAGRTKKDAEQEAARAGARLARGRSDLAEQALVQRLRGSARRRADVLVQ